MEETRMLPSCSVPQSSPPDGAPHWFAQLRQGDRVALDALVSRHYDDLRAIARQRLRGEWGTPTMATTELVHETYLRLLQNRSLAVDGRAAFFAVAANVMRRILVDAARTRRRAKRGGGAPDVALDEVAPFLADEEGGRDLLLLDEALGRLRAVNPRAAEVVVHRYFGGLTLEESARALGTSTRTVHRAWLVARSWLRKEIHCSSTAPMSQVATPASMKSTGRV
jgi:RNA polymerase sigma factor (TIGR02999 family)